MPLCHYAAAVCVRQPHCSSSGGGASAPQHKVSSAPMWAPAGQRPPYSSSRAIGWVGAPPSELYCPRCPHQINLMRAVPYLPLSCLKAASPPPPLCCFHSLPSTHTRRGRGDCEEKICCKVQTSSRGPHGVMGNKNGVTYDIIRSCAPIEKCNTVGGFSLSTVKVTVGVGCCSTDSCTPVLPQLTQDSSASNGVQCGICYSSTSMDCQPTGSMMCTGQETRCVTYSLSSSPGFASVYRGCGTQSLCDVQHYTAILTGYTVEHSFTCSSSSSSSSGNISSGALTCTSCVSLGALSPICTSSTSVQCSSSEVCATTYRKTTSQNGVTYDIIRSCAPIEKCNTVGGFSYSNVKVTMGIGCCSTDSCTPDLPQLTQDSSASNGVQCGICYSSSSTVCQPTGNMMCTGQETRCVAYSMSSSTGLASVFRGCGTQSLCDVQHYTAILTGSTVEHSFTCSSSSSSSALTCTSCVSLDASSQFCASFASVQCSSSEVCATTYRKFTFQNGGVTYDIIRSCAPKEKCNMVGGLSYSNVKVTMGIGCCSTDSCTPILPQLTQDSSASNGVQCGTCSSSSSMDCQPTGSMMCTGQETRCVAYSVSSTGLASVSQGCGTQSLCDIQHFTAILSGSTVEHRFTCSGAHSILSGGITPGIILIAVISVILMNRSM